MGTPDFAVPSLKALDQDERFEVVLTVSQPTALKDENKNSADTYS